MTAFEEEEKTSSSKKNCERNRKKWDRGGGLTVSFSGTLIRTARLEPQVLEDTYLIANFLTRAALKTRISIKLEPDSKGKLPD